MTYHGSDLSTTGLSRWARGPTYEPVLNASKTTWMARGSKVETVGVDAIADAAKEARAETDEECVAAFRPVFGLLLTGY